METRIEALDYIATCIAGPSRENDPAAFDIEAIAEELHVAAGGTWDLSHLDHDVFWSAVARHAKEEA